MIHKFPDTSHYRKSFEICKIRFVTRSYKSGTFDLKTLFPLSNQQNKQKLVLIRPTWPLADCVNYNLHNIINILLNLIIN